jgi:thiamine biosynthesis lipoprotein
MLLLCPSRASLVRNGLVFVLFLATLSSELKAQKRQISFQQTHRAMGTEFTIDLYAADEETAAEITDAAFGEVDRLEALLSNHRPSSELSRIGREAGAYPVTTDPELPSS